MGELSDEFPSWLALPRDYAKSRRLVVAARIDCGKPLERMSSVGTSIGLPSVHGPVTSALASLCLCLATGQAGATVLQVTDYDSVNGTAGITTLGFESGSTGFSTPPDISIIYGFSASAAFYGDGYLQAFSAAGIAPEKFGSQYLSNTSSYPRHTDITATFPDTVNFVGAWIQWTANVQTINFSLFGANDELLFSTPLQVPQTFDQLYYYGVFSDLAITRAVWQPVEDGFFVLDNLTYGVTSSPVPIPASVWLFGGALALLGRLRRKSGLHCARRIHWAD